MMPCDVDGCTRTAWARGVCRYHYDRITHNREGTPKGWVATSRKNRGFGVVTEAALAFAAAETDEQYERAWRRLYMASIRHAFSVIKNRRKADGRKPTEEASTEEDEG